MKSTEELIDQLKKFGRKNLGFLESKDFVCPKIHYYLADILRSNGMSNREYIDQMNLERSYGYQLLNGNRKPSREILIQTAILFHFDLGETQRLLKIGKREILYPRVKKDAIAIYAIEKQLSLLEYRELEDAYEEGI